MKYHWKRKHTCESVLVGWFVCQRVFNPQTFNSFWKLKKTVSISGSCPYSRGSAPQFESYWIAKSQCIFPSSEIQCACGFSSRSLSLHRIVEKFSNTNVWVIQLYIYSQTFCCHLCFIYSMQVHHFCFLSPWLCQVCLVTHSFRAQSAQIQPACVIPQYVGMPLEGFC